jgi:hypothetical protein
MISSHSSISTLSQNIRPYLLKADRTAITSPVANPSSRTIHELKRELNARTKSFEKLIGFLQDLTWIKILDEETRTAIIDLIQIAKDFYTQEREFIASLKFAESEESNAYLRALDDLQETIQDVESAIITLPKLDGFNKIFDELSKL